MCEVSSCVVKETKEALVSVQHWARSCCCYETTQSPCEAHSRKCGTIFTCWCAVRAESLRTSCEQGKTHNGEFSDPFSFHSLHFFTSSSSCTTSVALLSVVFDSRGMRSLTRQRSNSDSVCAGNQTWGCERETTWCHDRYKHRDALGRTQRRLRKKRGLRTHTHSDTHAGASSSVGGRVSAEPAGACRVPSPPDQRQDGPYRARAGR